jgi:hypothetical protein
VKPEAQGKEDAYRQFGPTTLPPLDEPAIHMKENIFIGKLLEG